MPTVMLHISLSDSDAMPCDKHKTVTKFNLLKKLKNRDNDDAIDFGGDLKLTMN